MFMSIVMYEVFFVSLYARSMYSPGHDMYDLATRLMYITAPLCVYKIVGLYPMHIMPFQLTNFLQGAYGCSRLLDYDQKLAQ